VESGFPLKSRDQQRIESGHRTVVLRSEPIALEVVPVLTLAEARAGRLRASEHIYASQYPGIHRVAGRLQSEPILNAMRRDMLAREAYPRNRAAAL
jgi:hypothetical protein